MYTMNKNQVPEGLNISPTNKNIQYNTNELCGGLV